MHDFRVWAKEFDTAANGSISSLLRRRRPARDDGDANRFNR
jgi:hypothetical protein